MFFEDTAPPGIYTLSLHDALPVFWSRDLRQSVREVFGGAGAAVSSVGVALAGAKGQAGGEDLFDQGRFDGPLKVQIVVVAVGRTQRGAEISAGLPGEDLDRAGRGVATGPGSDRAAQDLHVFEVVEETKLDRKSVV